MIAVAPKSPNPNQGTALNIIRGADYTGHQKGSVADKKVPAWCWQCNFRYVDKIWTKHQGTSFESETYIKELDFSCASFYPPASYG